MDFFTQQDLARRRTALLVVYLVVAIVLIALGVNVALYAGLVLSGQAVHDIEAWLRQPWWIYASLGTLGVIVAGSLARWLQLRGGGLAVARMVGARPLAPDTRDRHERRLRNVAEEMAIASGTPAPELYVLDGEPGINAFVAGYEPTQAVMVVTRGPLEHLDRDELQGVIGHEFSHVMNGDMCLNVRLMAVLAGIVSLTVLGRIALRSFVYRGRRSSRGNAGAVAAVAAVGLTLVVVGYAGLFFGRLIKAAVSRQREYLADASSVQYTRNPRGLASALSRIGEFVEGSRIDNPRAEELAHMCFGQSMRLSTMMATHPPLAERIKRIDPYFYGRKAAERMQREYNAARTEADDRAPASIPGAAALVGTSGVTASVSGLTSSGLVSSVGAPAFRHVAAGEKIHRSLPEPVLEAVHNPRAAAWVVYSALLMHEAGEPYARMADELLRRAEGAACADAVAAFVHRLTPLGTGVRLPVYDLALPALRRLSNQHRARTLRTARALTKLDRRMTLFEFVLLTLLEIHIGTRPRGRKLGSYAS
ncbi:MAG: M48 family metallopeptidase, partial [Gammaproteobacteria bacterium]